MTTVAVKTYINPDLLETKIKDIIGDHQYGELIFLTEESPKLSKKELTERDTALQDYHTGINIENFDDIKDQILGTTA